MYAHVITVTGWRWSDLDAMTLPQVQALLNYWRESPPIHVLLKHFMGVKNEPRDEAEEALEAEQYLNRIKADEFDAVLKSHGLP
ncbi:MAG: hypothetical protein FWD62_15470 [Betaproteobacteria bacterium]|nr:hypothetical protein [Betaproteobacteria bacterium]